jgi:ketosteroid isomerase-like protein
MRRFPMDDMIAVRRAVDRLLGGDLGPMLDLLAEDVDFEVAGGGDSPEYRRDWGRQAVVDHFTALGELVAFWQIDYRAVDGQVIAWGRERFTAEPCGLEGACEFALVFDLGDGMIRWFLVIEDLMSFFRRQPTLARRFPHARRPAHRFAPGRERAYPCGRCGSHPSSRKTGRIP